MLMRCEVGQRMTLRTRAAKKEGRKEGRRVAPKGDPPEFTKVQSSPDKGNVGVGGRDDQLGNSLTTWYHIWDFVKD